LDNGPVVDSSGDARIPDMRHADLNRDRAPSDKQPLPDLARSREAPRADGPAPDSDANLHSADAFTCAPEICNNIDDDLDGIVDEGFDKQTSILSCGNCGCCLWLISKYAWPKCVAGKCEIQKCIGNHSDSDGLVANGCEVCVKLLNAEICNGMDDDCNGMVDEGLQNCFPDTASPETCNGADDDFDLAIDEDFPLKGSSCDNGKTGPCFKTGVWICTPDKKGLMCTAPCC
jgi:hypothetical protein